MRTFTRTTSALAWAALWILGWVYFPWAFAIGHAIIIPVLGVAFCVKQHAEHRASLLEMELRATTAEHNTRELERRLAEMRDNYERQIERARAETRQAVFQEIFMAKEKGTSRPRSQFDQMWERFRQQADQAAQADAKRHAESNSYGRRSAGAPPQADLARQLSWMSVLDVAPGCDLAECEEVYRARAKRWHPDNGGSHEAMAGLNIAIAAARKHFGKA